MWRRTLDGWGYSPLDEVTRENVGDLRLAWSRALMAGTQEVTPLAYDGVLYMPNGSDVIQAIDAASGDLLWEYRRDLPEDVYEYVGGNARSMRNIAIYDRFIINVSDDDYAYALDATTGETAWETLIFDYQETPAGHSSGPIIADGRVDLRAELPAAGRAGVVRGGGARCANRRGAVAAADRARAGRAGRRDLGRRALRGARARRLLDTGQLRPRAAPDLPGHLGHFAGSQVPARRGRKQAPLPQLDAGPRRRDRRGPLVLPAPERSLGPRSSVRAPPGRHGGRAGCRSGELDQPAHPSRARSARS